MLLVFNFCSFVLQCLRTHLQKRRTIWSETEIIIDYSNKRNEAHKSNIYTRRKSPEKWTDAKKTLDDAKKKNGGKIPPELVKGKFLKKKINGAMKKKWGYERQIISDSDAIDSPRLKEIAELLRENKLQY